MNFKITTEDTFKPIVVEITLTSKEEVQDLFGILNHSAIVKASTSLNLAAIRSELLERFPIAKDNYSAFSTKLTNWFGA